MTYQEIYKKMLFNARMAEVYADAAARERACGDFHGLAGDFDRFARTARSLVARGAAQCAQFLEVVA